MNRMIKFHIVAIALLCSGTALAVSGIDEIYFPLSLNGTEIMSNDLPGEGDLPAKIVTRPVITGGAYPESLVSAVSLPYALPSAMGQPAREANVLTLCNIKTFADYSPSGVNVTIDLSEMKIPDELELRIDQVVALTLTALRLTLSKSENAVPGTYRFKILGQPIPCGLRTDSLLKDLEVPRVVHGPDR